MKKGLVIGLVALFVSIAFAPCIDANASKTSVDNELVEISIEICEIDGAQEQIIQLSEQDIGELEVIFDDMKLKLDNVNTKQETAKIFNDAVLSLNEFGLLPNDMSVQEVLQLVTNSNHEAITLDKINDRTQLGGNDDENFDCFIVGKTSNTMFFNPGWHILFSNIPPILILVNCIISFGWERWDNAGGGWSREPASGWVWTNGLNGVKTWEGDSLWGDLGSHYFFYPYGPSGYWYEFWYQKGATGFTGIRIMGLSGFRFFGTASHVSITNEFPGRNPLMETQNSHISHHSSLLSLRLLERFPHTLTIFRHVQ